MRTTRMSPCNGTLRRTILPGAVLLLWGCADLALEADRIPTELAILPDHGRFALAEPEQLAIVVKDQNGKFMRVPRWAPPIWKVSDDLVAEVGRDGTLNTMDNGWVSVTARLADLTANARFCITSGRTTIEAPAIYLTQAAQGLDNTTSLIAGRPALLRIFMIQDRASDLELEVQVTPHHPGSHHLAPGA